MLNLFRAIKLCAAVIVVAALLAGSVSQSYAENGTVRLKITKVGFIVGVGGGSGTLTFQGRQYRLSVGGVAQVLLGRQGRI